MGFVKCHHDPYQIPGAKKLLLGYKTVRTYGCFGCHEINGYKEDGTQIGPESSHRAERLAASAPLVRCRKSVRA